MLFLFIRVVDSRSRVRLFVVCAHISLLVFVDRIGIGIGIGIFPETSL